MRTTSAAIRLAGRTKSIAPAEIALAGMAGHSAVSGSWAKVTPPAALIALSPRVPSDPVPERTTPMAAVLRSSARELKNSSMGWCGTEPRSRGVSLRAPCRRIMLLFGGITYTRSGCTVTPSVTSRTGMEVVLERICVKALS